MGANVIRCLIGSQRGIHGDNDGADIVHPSIQHIFLSHLHVKVGVASAVW